MVNSEWAIEKKLKNINQKIAMEVHHPHHVTHKKKWGEYLLEFFMLFLAVFLGFIAENIRERKVEHERVKDYARSLATDIQRDIANMNYITGRIKMQLENTDSLVAYLKTHQPDEVRNIKLFTFTVLYPYPAYRWNRATLEQIKNSGSLRYFSDSLVRYISSYDALSHHMDEDFQSDQEWQNQATTLKNSIVDISYPEELVNNLNEHFTSTVNSAAYKKFEAEDTTPMLAKDKTTLKIFLNEELSIRRSLDIRANEELKSLIAQGHHLIEMLKQQYHFE
jgi:hypothetical protein